RLEMDSLVVVGLFRFFPADTPPGVVVPRKGYNLAVKPKFIPVANLYMSKDLSEKWTFGFGAFAPFGLSANSTTFKDSDPPHTKYVGRFAGTRPRLESFWLQPTAAYRINENSSIALGIALVHTHLMIEQSFLNPLDDGRQFGEVLAAKVFPGSDPQLAGRSLARLLPEGRSRVAGTSNSPGLALGYLYKHPGSGISFGVMYRSAVVHHLSGRASFAFTDDYPLISFIGADAIPNLFPEQAIKGTFTTPANFQAGISKSSFFWDSTIAVDFQMQDYRRFSSVPINFSKTVDTATPPERRLTFDFRNSYQLHLGFEKRWNSKTALRAGYIFDRSPVPDKSVGPLFPDSNRNSFTFGVSRERGNMEFTFFYQAMKFLDRTTNVPANNNVFTNGEYRNFAHLAGLGLRIHIGGTQVATPR
ncbi:MAG: outer membrane protein transport protein, partial [Acidobacteria bacterium]|nr:outer membrane protein transport protein [Acidobacteriota bacterium]